MKDKNTINTGFTLVELIVVIAITAFLASLAFSSISESRENTRVMDTGLTQKELTRATEAYFRDMGFYPPDVNRGWDPGFEQSAPWNPDGQTVSGVDDSTVPEDWETIIAEKWAGPYMVWPKATPWGGRYDYNYWEEDTTRNGCLVPKGIYAGAQGDYSNNNTIPSSAEQKMVDKGFDGDACLNGESQLLLWRI
ncbi:MAG: type II secretion system protein [Candidatus Paceibacterota bacterium]|jgi:prepilin-type N-terminal cleavage/methylation domain-containing protein|nr:type II secretion system GspH family protein [Candidatus Paceibacterota bacterium]